MIVFASSANAAIYPILSEYDELVVLPVTKPLNAFSLLRKYSLDVLIDTSQWPKLSALYSLFIKARFKIGFKTRGQFRHFGYDEVVEHSNAIHELENFRCLLKPLQIPCQGNPSFNLEKIASQNLGSIDLEQHQPYIVFHPWASGTRSDLRQWPIDLWVKLAISLVEDGWSILISGSPQNHADAVELANAIGAENKVDVLAGKLTLPEVAKALLGASAVISVNTGIAHLADHLKVPTIALNGPTNSARWGVTNSVSKNIDVPKEHGGGFLNLGFEYPSNPQYSMNQITVQAVQAALKQLTTK
ncbi:glycosyltransferase family 9 protein [Polynucleobacter sp. AP-Capit-er-40B-B4]|nr:glycosyltransferase family 9 protein [Polynucleobacter sp. AP-Capit-er-40B-B4]